MLCLKKTVFDTQSRENIRQAESLSPNVSENEMSE